jgi:hypothetical protein
MAYFNEGKIFRKEKTMTKPSQNHAQKLSKFVKQNSVGRLVGAEISYKKNWQRVDSNRRPRAYESPALPLSYAATGRI